MNIFLTGMTGHLGFNILRFLCAGNHTITVLVRNREFAMQQVKKYLPDYQQKISIVTGDLNDYASLKKGSEQSDCIIHAAAVVGLRGEKRSEQIATNVNGMKNILEAAKVNGTKHFIHVSSVQAIKSGTLEHPANETSNYHRAQSSDPYGYSKIEAEKLIHEYSNRGITFTIVHPGFICGPYDMRGSAMTKIIRITSHGAGIVYPPGGIVLTDVEAAARAIAKLVVMDEPGDRYILGGANLTYREIFQMLHEQTGSPRPVIPIPAFILTLTAAVMKFIEKLFNLTFTVSSDRVLLVAQQEYFSSKRAQQELGYVDDDPAGSIQRGYQWLKEEATW